MDELTIDQAIVITGFTGIGACSFNRFHEDAEKRYGHPIWTHQFASKEFWKVLKELYRDDFIAMCPMEGK